jgi:DNA-binding PadR family transcriptional regulator
MTPVRSRPTTAYAILGLLAIQPWSTYELAQQVQRSLNWFWPRAERRLYDEPKRLVADGLAISTPGFTGQRRRTVYEITAAGRDELADWLEHPPQPRAVEFEGLLKVFFADAGSRTALLATLDEIAADARDRLGRLDLMIDQALADGARFPERVHLQAVTLRQHVDAEMAVLDWVTWATEQVITWTTSTDPGNWAPQDELARLHERITLAVATGD